MNIDTKGPRYKKKRAIENNTLVFNKLAIGKPYCAIWIQKQIRTVAIDKQSYTN